VKWWSKLALDHHYEDDGRQPQRASIHPALGIPYQDSSERRLTKNPHSPSARARGGPSGSTADAAVNATLAANATD